jgi:hypothetical protein
LISPSDRLAQDAADTIKKMNEQIKKEQMKKDQQAKPAVPPTQSPKK